jgi:hypothetical protein
VSIATVPGYDAAHANVGFLPAGQAMGYATGSPWVCWTGADWKARPGALRVDQDPDARDPTADVLDVESGAATPADAPGWHRRATADFESAARPGQRRPAGYASLDSITSLVNAFIAGGVTSAGLIIADYSLTEAEAVALVANASGPFPVVGAQWRDAGAYDCDVFSVPWLEAVSGKPSPHPADPTYGKPRNLRAIGGHTTVRLEWEPPGTPGLPAPAEYMIYVYEGATCDASTLVPSYPRTARSSGPWEGGSLERGRTYTAHVVASGPGGANVRPWTYAGVGLATG